MKRRATLAFCIVLALAVRQPATAGLPEVIVEAQTKIVKVYGAGGFRGLEPYQSGFLISDEGHILTVFSYVLDTDYITVTLGDGRRFDAKLLGADPKLELAVLKIEASNLPHFDLAQAAPADSGTLVLAFSNLYRIAQGNEAVSAQQGTVAVKTKLQARRGVFDTPYNGPVYVLDAITNNPGASGGALTNRQGELLGMLGKELRNTLSNTWLNYAIPAAGMVASVDAIRAGKPIAAAVPEPQIAAEDAHNSGLLGLVLVPDVLDRTPPFVDVVRTGSAAAAAGLKPDDLVLFVNQVMVRSCKALGEQLRNLDRLDPVKVTVIRDDELMEFELKLE